jgi:phosphatidylglycerophosphate synthase
MAHSLTFVQLSRKRQNLHKIVIIIIIIIIIIIMAVQLQPFVGPWPLFQFHLIHSWQDSLDGGSARRKASINDFKLFLKERTLTYNNLRYNR